jgi:hypothetical protein
MIINKYQTNDLIESYKILRERFSILEYWLLLNIIKPFDINNPEIFKIVLLTSNERNELYHLLYWINKEIGSKIDVLSDKSLDVLLRIFTGMLNDLHINEDIKRTFHNNIIRSIKNARWEWYEYKCKCILKLPF